MIHDEIDLSTYGRDGLMRRCHGGIPGTRGGGRLRRDVRDALRTLGDLPRSHQQFTDGGADFTHGGCLLLGRRRLLVGGRL